MGWMRELWSAVRDTAFVAAQVVSLGALAMVLGLLALNAIFRAPMTAATTPNGPSRPLSALVPTLVPATSTSVASPAAVESSDAPTATPIPVADVLATAAASVPGWTPPAALATATTIALAEQPVTPSPEPTRPVAAATPAPPTATPAPAAPTEVAASPTSAVPGQLMKVRPAPDGLPARVRAEPTTKSPILIRVPLGATVEVVGATTGDEIEPGNKKWIRIRWKGVTGYVYSSLVGES